MVVNWNEQERMRQMLTDAISVMCKNGLKYSNKFCVEGLLGITIDDDNIMLVNIKETVGSGGMSVSPRTVPTAGRSPMGQRFAFTSPRRGRVKPVISSRGRGASFTAIRKRTLFPSPVKSSPQPVRQTLSSPPQQQQQQPVAMPLPDQSGMPEPEGPPPPKMKKEQGEEDEEAQDDVIEIGDDDDADTEATEEDPEIKQENQDQQQPSSSTDSQSGQQHPSDQQSLTDFLDNLMTQHDVGPGSSSSRNSTPARGDTQLTPKREPVSMPWEQQQQPPPTAVGYQSPTAQHSASSFQSQTVASWQSIGHATHLDTLIRTNLPLLSPPASNSSPGVTSMSQMHQAGVVANPPGHVPSDSLVRELLQPVQLPAFTPGNVTPSKAWRKNDVTSPKVKDPKFTSPFKNKGLMT